MNVMRQFQDAWAAVDIDRIVGLLTDDALLTMPPVDMRFAGAEAIGRFFATEPLDGRLARVPLVETSASGQPALAAYAEGDDGVLRPYGVMVFAVRADRIAGITGFPHEGGDLFERLGLPDVLG
jgi:RNA polymerase sigma-70 factor (ECF subfamily)